MSRLTVLALLLSSLPVLAAPRIVTGARQTPREEYAAAGLRKAVELLPDTSTIIVAEWNDPVLKPYAARLADATGGVPESYVIRRIGTDIIIAGADPSGVLYGAFALEDRIQAEHAIPATIDISEHPHLKLRGVALGMQKPAITYDGAEYDYRYTQDEFPFFYDKAAWTVFLDQLAGQRYNALYLWNGHPFTSLLRLPKYPEAQELPSAQLEQNIEMFHWLTTEADKRGIWLLQGFYNIHLSHAFARAHGVPYHLSAPTWLAAEYTRYCISEFIREYPSVGLLVTLGEAMGPHYGPQWMTQAILPGVKDGIAELSHQTGHAVPEPPIVVRAHATDIFDVMGQSKPLYSNIDTMFKWNGESLTWTDVRGPVRSEFERLVAVSNVQIANIHLLSNLEPFRWGDPEFIRQTVLSFQRIGIGGVHLYPLRYWEWPYSADKTTPLLNQVDRDWLWYEAWSRYAWNPERDAKAEQEYWTQRLAEKYGSKQAGVHILQAYELSGICAPRLLTRIGITEGNRQAFSLGMTMPQLIDANRFSPAQTLWTGDAPDGERLDEEVARDIHSEAHHGEIPTKVADEVVASAAEALKEARAAEPGVTKNKEEYGRIVTDMQAIYDLMLYYRAKTHAAKEIMLFAYDGKANHLTSADVLLAESVEDFRALEKLTDSTYRNAAGMETSQRRIPVAGGPNTNHWRDLLPVYEKELTAFRKHQALLREGQIGGDLAEQKQLPQVTFDLEPGAGEKFTLKTGEGLLSKDANLKIETVSPLIDGFTGVRLSGGEEHPIQFRLDAPGEVLVGFLPTESQHGTNLAAETEQWNLVLPDAITIAGKRRTSISIWAKPLPAGQSDLDLGKGTYFVVGFVPEHTRITPYVHLGKVSSSLEPPRLDWLFEN